MGQVYLKVYMRKYFAMSGIKVQFHIKDSAE